jgi:glutamyl-tRNA synthetase
VHVGGIRTALYAYLLAKQARGQFVLRLEDTDKKREVEGSDAHIIKSLHTLGIDYDEGPDIGGAYAPYRQSERLEHYIEWGKKLVKKGRAYADPYTPEEIRAFRSEAEQNKKAFLYRHHRPENPPEWDGTRPLRFKSEPKACAWHDAVMGDLHAGEEVIDDFVLIKSDGYPTYNFAHIIDDLEMEISHVIRGQEFIASTPNYLNLYEALEIDRPVLATMPHILNETGNKKLGKRDGAKDVLDYFRDGFIEEAMLNFIASMGWNDGTEQELFSKEELVSKFSLERVGRSGARFDEKRLIWMNGQWIKRLELSDLLKRAETFWGEAGQKASEAERKAVLTVVQDRLKTLTDLPNLTEFFFTEPTPDWKMVDDSKQLAKVLYKNRLDLLRSAAEKLVQVSAEDWNEETLQNTLNELLTDTNTKPPVLFGLIRLALTWAPFSPGLPETMRLLGKEITLSRLQSATKSLGEERAG